jgi:hypothetical protein
MRFCAFCFLIFVSDFLMRLYAFCCVIFLRDLLKRENSCFFGVTRCHYEICRVFAAYFLMRFRNEITCLLVVMRCPCERFLLMLVAVQFSYEIS